ncbi:sugar phosphate isomerase/epimerase family protein [Terriglobus roseus]|uniref:Sugar phosphate isomerase/epimerase n=1 Tax=Terriglobus roseus TaxID=392734 RepID=A0A1H4PN12_9BACT|nr:TIM barrel protein [Terriglobus roseus]SEC08582.1 Sugar phosphate isomerase/epimerase [Terriglobus roseus]
MIVTRRQFGKIAAATGAAAAFAGPANLFAAAKPNSNFNGVQIGVISYSYRQMPDFGTENANAVLRYALADGISAVELENVQEEWAGAPKRPMMQRPAGVPAVQTGPPTGGPPPRRQMTPEQMAAQAKFAEEMTAFRLSVPMSKYEALRKMYNDTGVSIYAFKITLNMKMQDAEFDYAFKAAKACGANQITMEMPDGQPELTKRIGDFGSKYKMMVGYHAHLQATPTTWDEAMAQSPYNGANLDIGHFIAAGNSPESALEFMKKNHARITSMHMKDRKSPAHGETNMPWGEGDTPIKQALQLMKKEGWKFPATIELEYTIPEGSDSVKEVAKSVAYAKAALA